MEKFEYQASCGNEYFSDIEVIETRGNRKICNVIMLHGRGGRSRWGHSYRPAKWIKERVNNIVLETEHFNSGTKIIKEIIDYT